MFSDLCFYSLLVIVEPIANSFFQRHGNNSNNNNKKKKEDALYNKANIFHG